MSFDKSPVITLGLTVEINLKLLYFSMTLFISLFLQDSSYFLQSVDHEILKCDVLSS